MYYRHNSLLRTDPYCAVTRTNSGGVTCIEISNQAIGLRVRILFKKQQTSWLNPQANYSDRRLSAKLVPIIADRGRRVVSTTNPHGR
jgi:hypothetical protein